MASISVSSLCFRVVAPEPIIITPIADTYVDSEKPTSNFGAANIFDVQFTNFSTTDDYFKNSYLLFDLSTISSDTHEINSAMLGLYCYFVGSTTTQVGVHSCSDNQWNEIQVTWSNAPSFSSEPLDFATFAFDDQWYFLDVTEEVKNSQGGYLTLVLTVEGGEGTYLVGFRSKDAYDGHPGLVIDYEATTQEPPVASFTYSPLAPKVNDTIAFDASGCSDADGSIVSYLWNFGDGETSSSQNPTHAYDQEGSYTITLTVTDDDGLTDNTTENIGEVVIPEFQSYALMLVALSIVAVAGILYKKKLKS